MEAASEENRYTYADYCLWDDDARYELIDGAVYAMSPAPSPMHQAIIGALYLQLGAFLKGKPCKVFLSPFDVRLNPDTDDDTVVQPDLLVICDQSKLDNKGCNGAPDMVIEVLSPASIRHDRFEKFLLYQKYGVLEYWIADPETKTMQAYVLDDGRYYSDIFAETGKAPVHILEGCTINLADVFDV